MFISKDPIGLFGGDNVFAYAPNPTGWVDPLGLDNLDALERYLNSPGMQEQITKAMYTRNYTYPNSSPANKNNNILKNSTIMANFSFAGHLGIGGDITFSQGKSYDQHGKATQCYAVTPCISGGTEAKLTGSITGSYTNAPSSKGLSSVTQLCGEGGVAAGGGVTAGVCQNSDGSTTGAGGVAFGGSLGASAKACQAITYCPGD